jgi:hypothetical protein
MAKETTLLTNQFKAIVTANDKLIAATKKGMAGDYAKLLKQLKVIVADTYEQYASEGSLSYSEMQKFKRIEKLKTQLDKATATGTKPVFRKMQGGLEDVAQNSYTSSLTAIAAVANANIGRELSGNEIQAILNKPWSGVTLDERIGLRRTDIGNRVRQNVLQGIIRGDTYEDQAATLKDTIVKDYARNGRLSEDLGHQVQSDATVEAIDHAREQDIEITKTWVTAGDDRVREDHAAMDGQEVLADEMFRIPEGPNAGMEADGPGLFGIPEEDINCRCWMVAGVRNKE